MQVIITLAGLGQRFSAAGHITPKPIIPVGGKPAIQYLIEVFPTSWKLLFVVGEHFRTSDIEETICNIRSDADILYTDYSERGPIDTVNAAFPFLNLDEPTIVSYCDYSLVWDAEDFVRKVENFDAAVVTYQGFHPTYLGPNSYCHLQVQGDQVLSLREKSLFTDSIEKEITSVGLYYFKSVTLLEKALHLQQDQDLNFRGEFYTSLGIQALVNAASDTRVLNYPITHMLQLGTPEDIERFDFWYKTLVSKNGLIKPVEISDYEKEEKYWQIIFDSLN